MSLKITFVDGSEQEWEFDETSTLTVTGPDGYHAVSEVVSVSTVDADGEKPVTVSDLKAALADLGVEVPSKATKAELQALLDAHESEA